LRSRAISSRQSLRYDPQGPQARLELLPGHHQFFAVGEVLARLHLGPGRGIVGIGRGDLFVLAERLADLLVFVPAVRLAMAPRQPHAPGEKRDHPLLGEDIVEECVGAEEGQHQLAGRLYLVGHAARRRPLDRLFDGGGETHRRRQARLRRHRRGSEIGSARGRRRRRGVGSPAAGESPRGW
jgi:hypothetical protein